MQFFHSETTSGACLYENDCGLMIDRPAREPRLNYGLPDAIDSRAAQNFTLACGILDFAQSSSALNFSR